MCIKRCSCGRFPTDFSVDIPQRRALERQNSQKVVVVNSPTCSTDSTKTWVVHCLNWISSDLGTTFDDASPGCRLLLPKHAGAFSLTLFVMHLGPGCYRSRLKIADPLKFTVDTRATLNQYFETSKNPPRSSQKSAVNNQSKHSFRAFEILTRH